MCGEQKDSQLGVVGPLQRDAAAVVDGATGVTAVTGAVDVGVAEAGVAIGVVITVAAGVSPRLAAAASAASII